MTIPPIPSRYRCRHCGAVRTRDQLATHRGLLECPSCLHGEQAVGLLEPLREEPPTVGDWVERGYIGLFGTVISCDGARVVVALNGGGRAVWGVEEVRVMERGSRPLDISPETLQREAEKAMEKF